MSAPHLLTNAVTRYRETCSDLLDYAKANRGEGIFNDVTLKVDNLSIEANRMVLACYSTFFERMFKSEMRERYETIIPVTGVDGKTADTLVNYIYEGQITIDMDSVMNLLHGADYVQLNDVKTFCFDYLMDRITSDNWYAIFTAAKRYRSDKLQIKVDLFIMGHFDEVVQSSDFKTVTKDDLALLICELNQYRVHDLLIYHAIMNWTKHNEEERKKEFPELFQQIKFDRLLSFNDLHHILSENLIQENVTCVKYVWSSYFKQIKTKEMKKKESKIIMIGGKVNCDKVTEIFNCYNIESKRYPDLPYSVEYHCLLKLNDVVFCVGGYNDSADYTDVYNKVFQIKLNKRHLKWKEFVPMNEKRCLMGATVFHEHLVVAGGWMDKGSLASTEYFNHSLSNWEMAPYMQEQRSSNMLVECNNYLFVLGGWDGKKCLSSVERLQSLIDKWEFVAPMLTCRTALAAVSLNGSIYAIGGRSGTDGTSRLKSVERYDPKLDKWSYVCEMNYVRSGACACVLHGRIFVAGGIDIEGQLVKNIECYDPSEDKWKIVQYSENENIVHCSAAIAI